MLKCTDTVHLGYGEKERKTQCERLKISYYFKTSVWYVGLVSNPFFAFFYIQLPVVNCHGFITK